MVVHDLKNPLSVVEANLEMMEIKKLQDCGLYLDTARHGCRLLFHMIQDVYEISKMEEGELHPNVKGFDVAEMVNACIREFEVPVRSRNKEVVVEMEPDLPPIRGDRDLLYRVLFNLLTNAVRRAEEGGSILVRVGREGVDHLRVDVEDGGEEIPAEYLDKVLEKLGQTEIRHGIGKGLGLPFCKMAVEAHGGRIRVESGVGLGNRFVCVLPLSAD
jgi:signal transduction histidine kinase